MSRTPKAAAANDARNTMTDATQLKELRAKQAKGAKGAPARVGPMQLLEGGGGAQGDTVPIQFKIPAAVYDEFNAAAGSIYGWRKGAKSQLFRRVWEAYKDSQ